MVKVILALVPSAGILFLFWRVLKALVEGDRRERAAEARWSREHGHIPPSPRPATAAGPAAGRQAPESGGREPESGGREPKPGGREPKADRSPRPPEPAS